MLQRLYNAVVVAMEVENSHGSDPDAVATAIAGLACSIAEASCVRGGALLVLTSHMPNAEPDEEKAVAAVRSAYAAARRPDVTVYS